MAEPRRLLLVVEDAAELFQARLPGDHLRESVLADRDHSRLHRRLADHRLRSAARDEAPNGIGHVEHLVHAGPAAVARLAAELASDRPVKREVARVARREAQHPELVPGRTVGVLALRTERPDEAHRADAE